MLDVNYTLKIREGVDHISTYSPLVNRIEGNAAILRAPNSSGKTYFLNLIAMALYGDQLTEKNSSVSPILQKSLQDIRKRKNEKLTFDLKLASQDGKTVLHASKTDPETDYIELRESCDGEQEVPLPLATFADNYYLVYDFPKNPLERIPDMVKSIKEEQERYKRKVEALLSTLTTIKKEIAASRDESQIEEMRKKVEEAEKNYNDTKNECNQLNVKKQVFEKYYHLISFDSHLRRFEDLDQRIRNYSNTQRQVQRSNKKYNESKNAAHKLLSDFSSNIQKVSQEIRQTELGENEILKKQIEYFYQCDYLYYLDDMSSFDYNIQKQKLEMMKKEIMRIYLPNEIKEASGKSQFYGQVIDLFKQAKSKNLDVSIPGIDKSLDQLITMIEREYISLQEKSKVYNRRNQLKIAITDLLEDLEKIKNALDKLRLIDSMSKEYEEILQKGTEAQESIDDLEKEQKNLSDRLSKIGANLTNCGYDVDSLLDDVYAIPRQLQIIRGEYPEYTLQFEQSEQDILQILNELKTQMSTKSEKDLPRLQSTIELYNDKLTILEKTEIHKYYDRRNDLEKIQYLVDSISRKLGKYETYISQIEKEQDLDEQGERYNEKLSEFLGKLIPSFPYQKEYVKPVKIDLFRKSVITDTNRQINMKNISTGQSMSLYIETILNRPEDDHRKLIVLFDEAGTMDDKSLLPLKETMATLAREGKILFALFVSANNSEPDLEIIL